MEEASSERRSRRLRHIEMRSPKELTGAAIRAVHDIVDVCSRLCLTETNTAIVAVSLS
jgi:hypothetical protein